MATLAENAAAVKAAQVDIDAAIVAKGGTTDGGLSNAAAAIASIPSGGGEPSWPVEWKEDGKTHLWFYFSPNVEPTAYFYAQFISTDVAHVQWEPGVVDDIAASSSYANRTLTHTYTDGGLKEVIIYGYDSIKLSNSNAFGAGQYACSSLSIRQAEFGGTVDGTLNVGVGTASLTAIKFPDGAITTMVGAVFANCASLSVAEDFSELTGVSSEGFRFCNRLKFIDLSKCESVGSRAFTLCTSLESVVSLARCRSIDANAFESCKNITTIGNLTSVETIGASAFASCRFSAVGDMPSCTSIGGYAFAYNSSLESFGNAPSVQSLAGVLHSCTSLKTVGDLSAMTTLGAYTFQGCTSLLSIGDMSSLSTLQFNFSGNCPKIESLTFRTKTHTDVEAITGFAYFPNRGSACVFHCSDGDFYRSGNSLLPVA